MVKKFLSYLLCLISIGVFSQNTKVLNLPTYDYKQMHFGATLGINISDLRLTRSYPTSDTVMIAEVIRQGGFNVGIISNFRLTNHLDFRFIPSLSFTSEKVKYTLKNQNTKTEIPIESNFLDFPFSFKYKSDRLNNGRAYLLGGIKFTYDMVSQAKTKSESGKDDEIIKLKAFDYYAELGFGVDCYFEYFKFAPEIKVSYGLRNMLVNDNTIYSNAIEKLKSTVVLISLNFE